MKKLLKKTVKIRVKQDRLLKVSAQTKNNLTEDYLGNDWPQEMLISGNLDLGKSGNPVTIFMEDEVTGEQMEVSGVKNAFLILEDTRRTSSGWLALAIGSVEKVGDVLGFLSQTTLQALKKLSGRN